MSSSVLRTTTGGECGSNHQFSGVLECNGYLCISLKLLHNERWQSFRRGGSVAFYTTIYAFGFLLSSLSNMAGFLPVLIYLSYMTVIILGVYFSLGTVGFVASYMFVYYIFKAVKAD
jgi:hypothetical protein